MEKYLELSIKRYIHIRIIKYLKKTSMKKVIFSLLLVSAFVLNALAQKVKSDKVVFKEYEAGYYQNSILKDVRAIEEIQKPDKKEKRLQLNMNEKELPNKLSYYKNKQWYQSPISQGNTGTCWSFSTISFLESEVYRLTGEKLKISEMYTVYWEYVEKARGFVQTRGESYFGEGSEGNAVTRMFKKYGAVPWEVYTGLIDGRKFHSHEKMFNEMETYLFSLKESNNWNEDHVLETIKSIMNYYMGEPPTNFAYNGETFTPNDYLNNILKINPDDYVEILSYMQEPYWEKVEYKVPDNWWHSKEYYNIPLDDYMRVLKQAVRNGYTVSIGGDVSEAGLVRQTQCAMIPNFDIPSEYITDEARQFRFSNKTTTDDHGMHLVGYMEKDGKDWYLIKDSSSGSRNNDETAPEFGFYFFHEDYVKLKMMGFTIHKDAVKDILQKF